MPSVAASLRKGLTDFLSACPTPWHTAEELQGQLQKALQKKKTKGKVEIRKVDGSLLASRLLPGKPLTVLLAHTDSPHLRLKSLAGQSADSLPGLEVYGGALLAPWFDRDLGVAGRVVLRRGKKLTTKLIDSKRPVAIIPSLAIHLDRDVNKGPRNKCPAASAAFVGR